MADFAKNNLGYKKPEQVNNEDSGVGPLMRDGNTPMQYTQF